MIAKLVLLLTFLAVAMARPQWYSDYGYGSYGYPSYYSSTGYASPVGYGSWGNYGASPYSYGGYGYY